MTSPDLSVLLTWSAFEKALISLNLFANTPLVSTYEINNFCCPLQKTYTLRADMVLKCQARVNEISYCHRGQRVTVRSKSVNISISVNQESGIQAVYTSMIKFSNS